MPCTWRNGVRPLVHAFQANTLTKEKLQDPPFTKITPLPTKPLLPYYQFEIP